MFFPVYALLNSKAVVDPVLYISTGSTTTVNLNVLTGGTEYLIGKNISNVPLSVNVNTEYLIGNNTAEVPLSFNVETEYLIGTTTVEIPITITPG